ncbi:MAG: exodeoxyribonuclease VII small subunit [Coleofasciculaceae cyanobacterium SM2_1_6]|nr:exodeoxyribonuclease VII small subunit [Coleofasciculaceae cyanobacterium SM2_1_6]
MAKSKNWNYEVTVAKVEEIINQIESGELELSEVFAQFTAATTHLQQCKDFLAYQQQQMNLLIATLEDSPEDYSEEEDF